MRLAEAELISLEAISGSSLTRYGKIMAALGLELKLGKFVALALEKDISFDAMVIAAVFNWRECVLSRWKRGR